MNQENKIDKTSYLSFRIGHEVFAVNVEEVREILEVPQITKVPKAPICMRGVVNLRGSVLPVIDSRMKFGMVPVPDTVDTCIIVLSVHLEEEIVQIGVVVDAVLEVFEISNDDLMSPPSIGGKYRTEFIKGLLTSENEFVIVLNVRQIFSTEEIVRLQEMEEENNEEQDETGTGRGEASKEVIAVKENTENYN